MAQKEGAGLELVKHVGSADPVVNFKFEPCPNKLRCHPPNPFDNPSMEENWLSFARLMENTVEFDPRVRPTILILPLTCVRAATTTNCLCCAATQLSEGEANPELQGVVLTCILRIMPMGGIRWGLKGALVHGLGFGAFRVQWPVQGFSIWVRHTYG